MIIINLEKNLEKKSLYRLRRKAQSIQEKIGQLTLHKAANTQKKCALSLRIREVEVKSI